MKWFNRIFARRLDQPCYNDKLPSRSRSHLGIACRQSSEAEQGVKKHLDLCIHPRLVLADEELALIVTPRFRDEIETERSPVPEAG